MWKAGFVTLAVSLSLCLSAFCEEEVTIPRGFAIGFGLGQQTGDMTININVTSPYLYIKKTPNPHTWCAVRISGDCLTKSANLDGETTDSLWSYLAARIGYVGAFEVSSFMKVFAEVGGVSVFPTTALASSTNPCFGLYGYVGNEVFYGKNLFTKNTSVFMEIGYESPLTENRFDKLANRPYIGWGTTVRAGARLYL
jgi:hypothetical protein